MIKAMFSDYANVNLSQIIANNSNIVGQKMDVWLLASSDIDMLNKGKIVVTGDNNNRRIKDIQLKIFEILKDEQRVETQFNTLLFTGSDSRYPEQAGFLGSAIGSIFTIVCCVLFSLPIAIISAIYLEEYSPKNYFTDFIEININNLAAVPSIIFGLLGLSVFINLFGVPRSSALVGGMTLSLMVLPTMVITTRNAMRTVPQSVKDAMIAMGSSKFQTLIHLILPLSLSGIMTGIILSISRALGETAPLIMIGMIAFIVNIPSNFTDPTTVLPCADIFCGLIVQN